MKRPIEVCVTCFALILSLSACTNPYDPGQRFVGGGLLGAASGAAIGGCGRWRTRRGDGRCDRRRRRCIWRGRHHAPTIRLLLRISRLLRLSLILRLLRLSRLLRLLPIVARNATSPRRWRLRPINFVQPVWRYAEPIQHVDPDPPIDDLHRMAPGETPR